MKRIISLIILVLAALVFTSCRVSKEPTVITNVERFGVTEIVHDTTSFTEPDSALINALLRCDSLGNVYIAEITELRNGRATTQTVKINGNKLSAECKVDSMAVYLQVAKVYKTSERSNESQPAPEIKYVDKPLSWWAKTINIFGYVMLGVIVAGLIYAVVALRGYLIGI